MSAPTLAPLTCRKCGAEVDYRVRGMCKPCRDATPLEPYGYLAGQCMECGRTDGYHDRNCLAVE